ncbi:MAG: hypothetical protein C5B59_01585 [Bacteroidetes bacterium]|nr:MAG: hypothetical protein C5B59_01585 [Bacteroidota bacterium]
MLILLNQLKKVTAISFLVLYTWAVSGIAIKAYYCCSQLKSLKLVLADLSKDKDNCCKIKYQSFKINDVHSAADIVDAPDLHFSFLQDLHSSFPVNNFLSEAKQGMFNIHAPPLVQKTPVYISICVFRI